MGKDTNRSIAFGDHGIKKLAILWIILLGFISTTLIQAFAAVELKATNKNPPVDRKAISQKLFKLQLPFVENQGQIEDKSVRYYTKTYGGTAFVTQKGELVYSFAQAGIGKDAERKTSAPQTFKGWTLKETLVGASKIKPQGQDQAHTKTNYFIGNENSKWRTNVPSYNSVSLGEVYKGINLSLNAHGKNVEKIFTVKPGADPGKIRLKFDGAQSIRVNNQGLLEVETGIGTIRFSKPMAYQQKEAAKKRIEVAYSVYRDTYGFEPINYDKSLPLIIDPAFVFSSYLGGSEEDIGYAIAVDDSGNAYIAGYTQSNDFPTTAGAYDVTFNSDSDVFVSKMDSSCSTLDYSTYIGGNSAERAKGIALDSSGNAYIGGFTYSADFPTACVGTSPCPVVQATKNTSSDLFVAKLNSNGDSLVYSTFLGGSHFDYGEDIAVDTTGDAIYTVGWTWSDDFNIYNALQPDLGGTPGSDVDGVVAKFVKSGSGYVLEYSTYLGGSGGDEAYALDIDAFGNAYVTGATGSSDFPISSEFQNTYEGGSRDAFVTKFNADGSAHDFSTYLGDTGYDSGHGIDVDALGNAYLAGVTTSSDFPTTADAFQNTKVGGGYDGFVVKLNSSGSTLGYSTFLGGSIASPDAIFDYDSCRGIVVDRLGNAYITGFTTNTNFPTTSNAFQSSYGGGQSDAFVTKINFDGSELLYSSYLGGSDADVLFSYDGYNSRRSADIALGPTGNAYVTGSTASTDFPGTATGFQTVNQGGTVGYPPNPPSDPIGNTEVAPLDAFVANMSIPADSDEDGLADYEEFVFGTDFLNPDSDSDGVDDLNDAFPLDGSETLDSDPIEIPIVTVPSSTQAKGTISGDYVVYEDNRNGNWEIYLYDIFLDTETRITNDTLDQHVPAISGNRIVWFHDTEGNQDIHMYDISTGIETPITSDTYTQNLPAISGDRIVWEDNRNGHYDIYMYDISTGIETQITSSTLIQRYADISGDRIVYLEWNGSWSLYMFDISTATTIPIAVGTVSEYSPSISNDRIVWTDDRNGTSNLDIYMYEISTTNETQITTNNSSQEDPAISGDRIVWEDARTGNGDIFMYDIAAASETQITTSSDGQLWAAISGDRIIWTDVRLGEWDIYMFRGDRIGDNSDNCPDDYNPLQEDIDVDGVGDVCDNCPNDFNPTQSDGNSNGIGDACDPTIVDVDGDGLDDEWEWFYFGDYDQNYNTDFDNDGLIDGYEFGYGTDPTNPDTDDDCSSDGWEFDNGYDPLDENDPPDHDNDCMPDAQEQNTDTDEDGINDYYDNCENEPNPASDWVDINGISHTGEQPDYDLDGVGDACDNCPNDANPDQEDADFDTVGDVCDNAANAWNSGQEDGDGDTIPDVVDNCPSDTNQMVAYTAGASMEWDIDDVLEECALYTGLVNAVGDLWQLDYDCDGIGDACDGDDSSTKPKTSASNYEPATEDTDGDGVNDLYDNCPTVDAPQTNSDCPGPNCDDIGDACDQDDDGDGIPDDCDSSPLIPNNPSTANDVDADGYIDSCDPDDDGDGILDDCDGDINPDSDDDGIANSCDNCPNVANGPNQVGDPGVGNQTDTNGNGVGDACEPDTRIEFRVTDPALSSGGTNNYDNWEPKDNRKAQIRAILYENNAPASSQPVITLTLLDGETSQIPGRYTNHTPGSTGYDSNYDFSVESVDPANNSITIISHDFGGKTVIEATAPGVPTAWIKIPRDIDGDGLWDGYELNTTLHPSATLNPALLDSDGVSSDGIFDGNRDQDKSPNNVNLGDGLEAFEEYRGIMWDGAHIRLSAEKKTLLIYGSGFTDSQFKIGPALEDNLELEVYTTRGAYEDTNLDVLEVTVDTTWSSGDLNQGHIRWIGNWKWDIPVLGESYFAWTDSNDEYHFGQPTVIYETSIQNYLSADRPYLDKETLEGGTLSSPYWGAESGMLEPAELNSEPVIEDQNGDGEKGKREDKNKDGVLNGDYVQMDKATWNNMNKLNPFDIDNDGNVDFPQQRGDPTALSSGKILDLEFNESEVYQHVITHEIGHAIGMGVGDAAIVDTKGHCLHETRCLMFQYSINWLRDDYFCPYHQTMIHIDHK